MQACDVLALRLQRPHCFCLLTGVKSGGKGITELRQTCPQAAREPAGSIERFLLVAAFAVSGYSSTAGRTSKPFNPLLGETYELVHAEKGFRAIVEKVCDAHAMSEDSAP